MRRPGLPLLVLLVLAAATATVGCSGETTGGGDRLDGRWRHQSEQGASEMTLEDRGDTILLRADGEEAVGRRTGPGRYEGEMTSGDVTMEFVLERRGEQLAARYTLRMEGTPGQALPEVLYSRLPGGEAGPPGPSGGGDPRMAGMAGHWRFTEVLGSGGVSLVTDHHLVLRADGTCSTWSRSEGVASAADPETPGRWRLDGEHLFLQATGTEEWVRLGRFVHDGDRLLLVRRDGTRQVYERL